MTNLAIVNDQNDRINAFDAMQNYVSAISKDEKNKRKISLDVAITDMMVGVPENLGNKKTTIDDCLYTYSENKGLDWHNDRAAYSAAKGAANKFLNNETNRSFRKYFRVSKGNGRDPLWAKGSRSARMAVTHPKPVGANPVIISHFTAVADTYAHSLSPAFSKAISTTAGKAVAIELLSLLQYSEAQTFEANTALKNIEDRVQEQVEMQVREQVKIQLLAPDFLESMVNELRKKNSQ